VVPSLEALTDEKLVFPRLEATDVAGVLAELAQRVAASGVVRDAGELQRRLQEREALGSTAIGRGIAIPHCKLDEISQAVVAVGLSPGGIDFQAGDGQPVRVLFVVASPARSPAVHLQCLALISRWARSDDHLERLLALDDAGAIVALLREP
jgi:mannitol/fructose-specific phosphotransferase system IIA component (Ntr-type)